MSNTYTAETTTLAFDSGVIEDARPLDVRWVPKASYGFERKLQQRWSITTYSNGGAVGLREEWRDVPFVGNPG